MSEDERAFSGWWVVFGRVGVISDEVSVGCLA